MCVTELLCTLARPDRQPSVHSFISSQRFNKMSETGYISRRFMASVAAVKEVLVTGASGYVATHIIRLLLSEGYQVRGTVRSLANETKIKPLRRLCPDAKFELKLVEADLLKKDSWLTAVEGCSHVIHVASPFPQDNPKDENEVIKPAVDGTINVLSACHQHRIKRVVLTSSTGAIHGEMGNWLPKKVFTEDDWGSLDRRNDCYFTSKILAEKAAWEFVDKLPKDEKFELAVINPFLVQGPMLCGSPDSGSFAILKKLIDREMPLVPKFSIGIVDVRDVALAHVRALTVPEAAGHRHILCARTLWFAEIAKILDEEFRPQGYNVPTTVCPYALLWVNSWFDKVIGRLLQLHDVFVEVDNTRMRTVLGITPMDVKQTVIDMAYSMIDHGIAKKTSKYRPRTT